MLNKRCAAAAAVLGLVVLAPGTAFAYVGPGAGLSAIGTFLALVAACFLALVGFVWYPVKRLLGGKSRSRARQTGDDPDAKTDGGMGRQ
jgi:hypothetical protein